MDVSEWQLSTKEDIGEWWHSEAGLWSFVVWISFNFNFLCLNEFWHVIMFNDMAANILSGSIVPDSGQMWTNKKNVNQ